LLNKASGKLTQETGTGVIIVPLSRFNRRIRIVSFRLSEREYATVKEFCETHGLRGISDLARRAIHHLFSGHDTQNQRSVLLNHATENGVELEEKQVQLSPASLNPKLSGHS
jgi:hypothetical protein